MNPVVNRTDTDEVVEYKIEDYSHSVMVDRKRSADHDHIVIHDIAILTRSPGGGATSVIELPHEHAQEFIQALIDAYRTHKKWLQEGANWNLGEDGV